MMHTENSITLIMYDITSAKLRRRVDKVLKDYGFRLQFSVFLCRLDKDGVDACCKKLTKAINSNLAHKSETDSIFILQRVNMERLNCILGNDGILKQSVYKIY